MALTAFSIGVGVGIFVGCFAGLGLTEQEVNEINRVLGKLRSNRQLTEAELKVLKDFCRKLNLPFQASGTAELSESLNQLLGGRPGMPTLVVESVLGSAVQGIVSSVEDNLVEGLGAVDYVETVLRITPEKDRYLQVSPPGTGYQPKQTYEVFKALTTDSSGRLVETWVTPARGLVPEDTFVVFVGDSDSDSDKALPQGDVAMLFADNPGDFQVTYNGVRYRALRLSSFEISPKNLARKDVDQLKRRAANGEETAVTLSIALKTGATDKTEFLSFRQEQDTVSNSLKQTLSATTACTGSLMKSPVEVKVPVTVDPFETLKQ